MSFDRRASFADFAQRSANEFRFGLLAASLTVLMPAASMVSSRELEYAPDSDRFAVEPNDPAVRNDGFPLPVDPGWALAGRGHGYPGLFTGLLRTGACRKSQ